MQAESKKHIYALIGAILLIVISASIAFWCCHSNKPIIDENKKETQSQVELASTSDSEKKASDSNSEDELEKSYEEFLERIEELRKKANEKEEHRKHSCSKKEEKEEEKLRPVDKSKIYIANDIHYYPSWMSDFGEAYRQWADADDGKDTQDISTILDIWIDSIIEERPATVILAGDITYNGEKDAHLELASKLHRLTEEGIQVLVIPGNHDINNHHAASYWGDVKGLVDTLDGAEDFYNIYQEFGYDQALKRDEDSLSYLYALDDKHWILMIDASVYDPENKVYGYVKESTLTWMQDILSEAKEKNIQLIPISHQNLLNESRLYNIDCMIKNNKAVIELINSYNIKLWISGHLHLQRIKSYLPEPGANASDYNLTEIVTGAFSMYPFPYGRINLGDNEALSYNVSYVNVGDEINKRGIDEFDEVIDKQASSRVGIIPDDMKQAIAEKYSELLMDYICGNKVDSKSFKGDIAYSYIERFMDGSSFIKDVEGMLKDCNHSSTEFKLEANAYN